MTLTWILVARSMNLGYHWWRGDSYRMSPPPNFPFHYGMVGPMLNVHATAPVNVNNNDNDPSTPSTEMTTVTNSNEVVCGGKGLGDLDIKTMK